jgi:hypothetical protein
MAFISISEGPSPATYEEVAGHLDLAHKRPAGLLLHTAGEGRDGRVRIVDIWESEQAMRTFSREQLWPALETAGIDHERITGEREVFESFEYLAPR